MVCELFLNKALTEKVLRSYQSIKKPNVALHGESLLRVPVVLGSRTSCGKGPGLPAGARSRCVRALGRQGLPGRYSREGPPSVRIRQRGSWSDGPCSASPGSHGHGPQLLLLPCWAPSGRSSHCALRPGARPPPPATPASDRPPPPALSLPQHLRCPVKHRPHSGTSAASPTAPQPPRGGARPGLRLRPPPPAFATQGFEAVPLSTMFQPRRGPWPGSVNLSGKRVTSSFPRPSAKASVSFPRGQR